MTRETTAACRVASDSEREKTRRTYNSSNTAELQRKRMGTISCDAIPKGGSSSSRTARSSTPIIVYNRNLSYAALALLLLVATTTTTTQSVQTASAFAPSNYNARTTGSTRQFLQQQRRNKHMSLPLLVLSASKSNDQTNAGSSEQLPTSSMTTDGLKSSPSSSGSLAAAAAAATAAVTTPTTTAAGNPPFLVTLDDASKYSYNEAIERTLGWVGAAIVFGGALWAVAGPQAGQEFFAGYLVEQSLSVDNLFVFLLLFEYFKVPLQYQDRVLNWGIYGAIIMRSVMIGIGAAALQHFHAILLVFAAILVYSSARFFVGALFRGGDGEEDDDADDPSQNSIVKFSRSLIQATDHFDGDRFFTMVNGVRTATPLFICMIALEISDVVFAVDSIPAVFGVTEVRCCCFSRDVGSMMFWIVGVSAAGGLTHILLCRLFLLSRSAHDAHPHACMHAYTQNPLIVFSSNIFAIMGLRSLYTILSKAATDLKYLEPAVALVLGFIGSKMIAEYFEYLIPTNIALAVVATLLGSGVGLSVLEKQKEMEEEDTIAMDEARK